MNRYLDIEKLIAEIERFKATEYGGNTLGDDVANGALDYVLEEIIPSLLQEQPEVDLEKETKRWWKEHLHLNPENQLWMDAHQSVSLARYFYELGLNARKEE